MVMVTVMVMEGEDRRKRGRINSSSSRIRHLNKPPKVINSSSRGRVWVLTGLIRSMRVMGREDHLLGVLLRDNHSSSSSSSSSRNNNSRNSNNNLIRLGL